MRASPSPRHLAPARDARRFRRRVPRTRASPRPSRRSTRRGRRGPFAPSWASLAKFKIPEWYQDAQVRHLHPLGRLLGARRSATSGTRATCTSRATTDVRAPRRDLRPAVDVRLQGLHPAVQGGEVRRARAGPRSSRRRARATSCPWPSITTASRCTTAASRTGAPPKMGPEARRDRRAGRGRARPRGSSSASRRTAPSTGGSSTRA